VDGLKEAMAGACVLSEGLENVKRSMLANNLPFAWQQYAWPSEMRLSAWIRDLMHRLEFVSEWYEKGSLHSYWFSGLIYPQGFLTAILQKYARKEKVDISKVSIL